MPSNQIRYIILHITYTVYAPKWWISCNILFDMPKKISVIASHVLHFQRGCNQYHFIKTIMLLLAIKYNLKLPLLVFEKKTYAKNLFSTNERLSTKAYFTRISHRLYGRSFQWTLCIITPTRAKSFKHSFGPIAFIWLVHHFFSSPGCYLGYSTCLHVA